MKYLVIILLSISVGASPIQAQTGPATKGVDQKTPAVANQAAQPPATAPDRKEDDCGCDAETPADLFAVVNDVKITAKEVDEAVKDQADSLRKQVVDARSRELYLLINSRLLEAEAKKRGISPSTLLSQEVVSKTKEPTEAEAQAFYDQNKDRIQGDFKTVKSQVIDHLRNQRQGQEAKSFAERLRAAADVKVLVEKVTPPENEADRARVLATINGANVTSGDVEDSLKPIVYSVREQLYRLRKQQLDLAINTILLEQEAQKKKMTANALLEAEIKAKVKPQTEEDARKFYDENKEKIKGEFVQLKHRIVQYLLEQQEHDAQQALAQQWRASAVIRVFLAEPEPPTYAIATDDQPSKGAADAPVTIVEFTDYQCQSCAQTQPVMERLVAEYGGKVRLVMRDFPLEKHNNAFRAAEAAEAARDQGKYWEYIQLLFQNQSALAAENLKEYATRLGLDRARFDETLDGGSVSERVKRDLQEGMRLGVNATPTVFVNGRPVKDRGYDSLKSAIEAALAKNGNGATAASKAQ